MIDACLFAGEMSMLELRMRTLREVVDHFVVVACTTTHQGELSDWNQITDAYLEAIDRAKPERSILHWVSPDLSDWPAGERGGVGSPWYQKIERQHRDGMRAAVETLFDHSVDRGSYQHIVMCSDVDEIPTPGAVRSLIALPPAGVRPGVVMEQRFHSTYLDCLHPHQPWLGTCAQRAGDLEPQAMRDSREMLHREGHVIHEAGWHFSWFGTDDERERKMRTFSHAEIAARGDDPAEWRALGTHANGEQLVRLSSSEMLALDWPAPLLDGSWTPPESWRAP